MARYYTSRKNFALVITFAASHVSLSISFTVGSQPSEVSVFQESPTSVRMFWNVPEPIDQTTGYVIYYTDSTSSGSVTFDGPFINNEFVDDLTNGLTYTFSVAGRSIHLESEPSTAAHSPVSLRKWCSLL